MNGFLDRNDGKNSDVNGHEVCLALVNIQGSLSVREDIDEVNLSQLLCALLISQKHALYARL